MTERSDLSLQALQKTVRSLREGADKPEDDTFIGLSFVVGMAWHALTFATHDSSWVVGALLGIGSAFGLYILTMIIAGVLEGCGVRSRYALWIAWPLTLIAVGVPWLRAYDPDWVAYLMGAVGLGGMVPALWATRTAAGRALRPWSLSKAAVEAVAELPAELPDPLEEVFEAALRDCVSLRQVAEEELADDPVIDAGALLRDAESTLVAMLQRAPLALRLIAMASEREDEPRIDERVDKEIQRLATMGATLREALQAAIEYAGQEGPTDAAALRDQVELLQRLSSSHEEIEADLGLLDA